MLTDENLSINATSLLYAVVVFDCIISGSGGNFLNFRNEPVSLLFLLLFSRNEATLDANTHAAQTSRRFCLRTVRRHQMLVNAAPNVRVCVLDRNKRPVTPIEARVVIFSQ